MPPKYTLIACLLASVPTRLRYDEKSDWAVRRWDKTVSVNCKLIPVSAHFVCGSMSIRHATRGGIRYSSYMMYGEDMALPCVIDVARRLLV